LAARYGRIGGLEIRRAHARIYNTAGQ